MTKLTKREKFEMLLAIEEVKANTMLVDFINHELELLAKKNSADKKPTAQQVANQSIQKAILDEMAKTRKQYTITDLIKTVPECADLTNQRVSALVKQLVDTNHVVRTEDKRKAYFSIA